MAVAKLSIADQIQELTRTLLLTSNPDKAARVCAELHRLKAKLYDTRKRCRSYRDRHLAFQRSLIPTSGHSCTEAKHLQ